MATGSSISEEAKILFTNQVHELVQQKNSRLKPYAKVIPIKGKFATYDRLGPVEMGALDGRYAPVEFFELEHSRRKITKQRFGATLAIDDQDIEEILRDPQSDYANQLARAAMRRMDRVIYAAMFADVVTGEDLDTTVTYANDGGVTVDATGGLVYEKFQEIHENFIDNDVTTEEDAEICMGITGTEHTDLTSEAEFISADFTKQMVVDNGKIRKANGIHLVHFAGNRNYGVDPILSVTSGVRTTFAMAKGAMVVGISRDWKIKYEDRNDLYDTKQVKISGVLGAVRTEGKLIQKVTTTA